MRPLLFAITGLFLSVSPSNLYSPVDMFVPAGLVAISDSTATPYAYPKPDPRDALIFQQKIDIALGQSGLRAKTLAVAHSFLGTRYVLGTLNRTQAESLTVNLHELDCWTFVENSLAIALASRDSAANFENCQEAVRHLRYWGGQVDGYGSRVHYFTGWLLQAEKLGYVQDLTAELGGVPYRKSFNYMSLRPKKYPPLQDPANLRAIKSTEARLSRHAWHFIPKNKVAQMEHLIHDADIILLTSWKPGLDIAHEGFAVKKNGRIYLMHASSLNHRVIVSGRPLPEYMATQKGQTGIMVARLVN